MSVTGKSGRLWFLLGATNGLLAVACGAYGWHGLNGDPFFMMAAQYQMWHGLALLALGFLANRREGYLTQVAGILFCLGLLGFSGTLYGLALTGEALVPGAAPAGGLALMAGWLVLGVAGWRSLT